MLNLDDFFSLRIEGAGLEMTVTPRVNNQLEPINPIVVCAMSRSNVCLHSERQTLKKQALKLKTWTGKRQNGNIFKSIISICATVDSCLVQEVAQKQSETDAGRFLAFRKSFSVVDWGFKWKWSDLSIWWNSLWGKQAPGKIFAFSNHVPRRTHFFFLKKCRVLLTHSKLYLLTRGITFLCILWILRPHVRKSDLLHSKHRRSETFPEPETMQITDTDNPIIKTATCQRTLCRMCTSLHQSTVEFSIKVCMNKFCVWPWQPCHKGPFNVNLS